mgnify:CR=1 FL=1
MTKKLEGLFGLKLGEYFDESKYSIIEKSFNQGNYHKSLKSFIIFFNGTCYY